MPTISSLRKQRLGHSGFRKEKVISHVKNYVIGGRATRFSVAEFKINPRYCDCCRRTAETVYGVGGGRALTLWLGFKRSTLLDRGQEKEQNVNEISTMLKWRKKESPCTPSNQVENRKAGGKENGGPMQHLSKPLDVLLGQMSGCCVV